MHSAHSVIRTLYICLQITDDDPVSWWRHSGETDFHDDILYMYSEKAVGCGERPQIPVLCCAKYGPGDVKGRMAVFCGWLNW